MPGYQLLTSPWVDQFDALVDQAQRALLVSSPFVGKQACRRVANHLHSGGAGRQVEVYVLTNLSLDNMLSGATDPEGLLELVQAVSACTVRFLPGLHAKVYVADAVCAVITSANLTEAGLARNFEYGVLLSEPALVSRVREDLLQYGSLGSYVTSDQLRAFARAASELKEMKRRADRSANAKFRRDFSRRVNVAQADILRVRAAGRTPHAIFADAILHVLRSGPKATPEIHHAVKAIHPDLCDDSVDRVIDGEHFGKKWKHAVRTAQQYLKRQGLVRYEDGLWGLVP